jgi:hypothetical protein
LIGSVLKHRYEVIEKIGDGSLFTVYKCEDKIDNRTVAAKLLLPQYAANRMFAERILVEAQAMVGMSHPGIVEVYDCGEENGNYFVIVEYVRGVDLKERVRRNAPFSLTTVVDVGMSICEALDFTHRRGFVHGDLRPGNILVTPEGHVKLADFWVANAVASAQSLRTSALMRSVHYMAPEVAEGKPVTPAGDIYSLGIVLFELLTANVPFDGDTPISIALKHAREPVPSLRALNPGIPKLLEAVVGKALQKIPQDRFRSAKSMLNDLKGVRDGLNLAKPITWSAPSPGEKTVEAPPATSQTGHQDPFAPSPPDARRAVDDGEPVILAAVKKTMLVVVSLIAVMVVAVMIWAMTAPSEVKIPALVGKTVAQAQVIAGNKGIELTIRSEQFNEDYPDNTIYYMNPAPGRSIKEGKSVDVWVSKGSRYAGTPNVSKLSLEDAKDKISAAGLNVGEVSQDYSDSVPAGNVISQTPAPGTRQDRGQPVNVVFSLGAKPSDVVDGEQPEQNTQNASKEPRSFDVTFLVPEGAENQRVQIAVVDDYGENIAYSDTLHPGDKVKQTVQGVGDKITLRVYIDDKLVREEQKWR